MLELVEVLLGLEPEAGIWFARALGSPLQRAVQQRAEEFEWELVHWGVAGNPDLDFEKDFPEDFSARILALPDCGRLAEGSGWTFRRWTSARCRRPRCRCRQTEEEPRFPQADHRWAITKKIKPITVYPFLILLIPISKWLHLFLSPLKDN
jgi:hypothetical protein